MITIYDIAQITGFSVATVTRILSNKAAISEKAKERVFLAAKLTGFTNNNNIEIPDTKSKNKLIGVIVERGSFTNGLEHPLFGGIINSFQAQMEADGYDLIFISKETNPQLSYIERCKTKNISGVLIINSIYGDPEITRLAPEGIPCVSSNEFIPGICTIVSENKDSARKGIEYLIAKGHTKIGYLGGPFQINSPSSIERCEGYKLALKGAGIKYNSAYIEKSPEWELEAGCAAAKRLFKKAPDLTAVFCASDQLAAGTIKYLKSIGKRVPEDVSLIGFDDSLIASCSTPAITTFRQDRERLASLCAEKLTEAMNGLNKYEIIRVPVHFIERDSVADIHDF